MYATSLGNGGTLPIHAKFFPSEQFLELKLTGLQQEVMRESMHISLTVAWNLTSEERKKEIRKLYDGKNNKYGINISATVLKIQPSTPDLIPYYIKWKTPSVALDNMRITGGYLIYGNIANIEDKTLIHLFDHQLNGLNNTMDELSIKELPYDLDTLEKKKLYLTNMALESENESDRFQLPIRLDMIQYSTIDDIRKKLFIGY